MGRGSVGGLGVGGGFLDFGCRKKPPVRGRAERGRVSKGAARRAWPGTRPTGPPGGEEGGRVDDRKLGFLCFVCVGRARP